MNHPMRKRYNNNSGGGNNRRSNNNRGGHRNSSGGAPRPRKNFRALEEKFLNQAKDAMASGDRILAEYYLQHADHYYRENEAFLADRNEYYEKRNANRRDTSSQDQDEDFEDDLEDDISDEDDNDSRADKDFKSNSSSLPSFLTSGEKSGNVKVVNLQDWDE